MNTEVAEVAAPDVARIAAASNELDVVAATGFELVIPDPVPVSRWPTAEELELIRDVVDPGRLRDKELKP